MNKDDLCLILTATIEVKNVHFTDRNITTVRLNDYLNSFQYWISHKDVKNIIFIENSGFDLSPFKNLVCNTNINIEFISFEQEFFNPKFGKGYGEKLILNYLVDHSLLLCKCDKFIKISGRYIVRNYSIMLNKFDFNTDIYCDISKNLRYSESVFFGGSVYFLKNYIYKSNYLINDSLGLYFEHFLAKCYLDGIKDNLTFQFLIIKPTIIGFSGTSNGLIKPNIFKNFLLRIITNLKFKLLKF